MPISMFGAAFLLCDAAAWGLTLKKKKKKLYKKKKSWNEVHTVVFYITDRAVGAGKQPVRTSFIGKPRGAVFYSVILFDKLWHEQHTVPLCTVTSLDPALGFLPGFHFFLLNISLLLLMHWALGTLSQISASCRNLPACNLTCLVTSSLQRKQGIYINKQKSAQDGKQQQQQAVPVLPCPCASVCS